MEKKLILCDTNIIIELYKNNQLIISALQSIGQPNIAISSITAGELIYGALNKKELSKIKKDIDSLTVVHVNELISQKFIDLMLVYSKSHGLAIPDAIIAATSLVCNINLFTLNAKDFTFIKGITLHNM